MNKERSNSPLKMPTIWEVTLFWVETDSFLVIQDGAPFSLGQCI